MIVLLVLILAVCTSTGILIVVAGWAVAQIEIKLFTNCFGFFIRLD